MKQKKREKEAEKQLLQMAAAAETKSEAKDNEVATLHKQPEKSSNSLKAYPNRSTLGSHNTSSFNSRNQYVNHTSSMSSIIVKSELVEQSDLTV